MSDIGPGDWVEYVGDGNWLTRGAIYLCTEIKPPSPSGCMCDRGFGCPGILVAGPSPREGYGYCIYGFRPIYRPKSEIIEHLKAPVPELEPA